MWKTSWIHLDMLGQKKKANFKWLKWKKITSFQDQATPELFQELCHVDQGHLFLSFSTLHPQYYKQLHSQNKHPTFPGCQDSCSSSRQHPQRRKNCSFAGFKSEETSPGPFTQPSAQWPQSFTCPCLKQSVRTTKVGWILRTYCLGLGVRQPHPPEVLGSVCAKRLDTGGYGKNENLF